MKDEPTPCGERKGKLMEEEVVCTSPHLTLNRLLREPPFSGAAERPQSTSLLMGFYSLLNVVAAAVAAVGNFNISLYYFSSKTQKNTVQAQPSLTSCFCFFSFLLLLIFSFDVVAAVVV